MDPRIKIISLNPKMRMKKHAESMLAFSAII
jgi:hypothetical protein